MGDPLDAGVPIDAGVPRRARRPEPQQARPRDWVDDWIDEYDKPGASLQRRQAIFEGLRARKSKIPDWADIEADLSRELAIDQEGQAQQSAPPVRPSAPVRASTPRAAPVTQAAPPPGPASPAAPAAAPQEPITGPFDKMQIEQEPASGYDPRDEGKELKGFKGQLSRISPYWYEPPPPERRLDNPDTAENEGETEAAYEQRTMKDADAKWAQALQRAKDEGRRIYRYKDETNLLDKVGGAILPMATMGLNAVGQTLFVGLPDQVAAEYGDPNVVQARRQIARSPDFPIVGPAIDATGRAVTMAKDPVLKAMAGKGMGLARRVFGGNPVAPVVAGTIGTTAADQALRSGVKRLGGEGADLTPDQRNQQFANEMVDAVGGSLSLLPITAIAGSQGLKNVNELRSAPGVGRKLRQLERQGGRTVGSGYIEGPPAVENVRRISSQRPAATHEEMAAGAGFPSSNMEPAAILRQRGAEDLRTELGTRIDDVAAAEGRANAYLETPAATGVRGRMGRVVDALRKDIAEGRDNNGRALPREDIDAKRKLLGQFLEVAPATKRAEGMSVMSIADARKLGIPLPDHVERSVSREVQRGVRARQLLKNPQSKTMLDEATGERFQTARPPEREPGPQRATIGNLQKQGTHVDTAAAEQAARDAFEAEQGIFLVPRKMTPRQIERTIENFQGEDLVRPELEATRARYPKNPGDAKSFAELRAEHAQVSNATKRVLEVATGDPNLTRAKLQEFATLQKLDEFVGKMARGETPNPVEVQEWKEFVAARPTLAKAFDNAQSAVNYDDLVHMAEGGAPGSAVRRAATAAYYGVLQKAVGAFAVERALRWLAPTPAATLRRDPAMKWLAGVERGGPRWHPPLQPPPARLPDRQIVGDVAASRAVRGRALPELGMRKRREYNAEKERERKQKELEE